MFAPSATTRTPPATMFSGVTRANFVLRGARKGGARLMSPERVASPRISAAVKTASGYVSTYSFTRPRRTFLRCLMKASFSAVIPASS